MCVEFELPPPVNPPTIMLIALVFEFQVGKSRTGAMVLLSLESGCVLGSYYASFLAIVKIPYP